MRRSILAPTILAAFAGLLLACSEGGAPTEPPLELEPHDTRFGVATFEAPASAFFGPETFVRDRGKPTVERRTVELTGYGAPYTLRIRNGDEQGRKRVSSGEVHASGERVLGPSDFSPRIAGYEIPVEATDAFELAVELRGAPGSELTAWVEGTPLPASVAVTPEAALIEALGETVSFAAEVFGPQGEPLDDPVTWSSSDESVATVDGDGVVTAVANGEATITAASGSASAEAHIEVQAHPPAEEPDPETSTLELSAGDLTADGETTATATVTLYDTAGVRVREGGHDVAFEITPINENTAGATITGVTDNGDGTYTATFIAPFNNGAGTLTATLPEPISTSAGILAATADGTGGIVVGSAELTYSGGNTLPTATAETLLFPEDVGGAFTLSGIDADGDELTWRLVEIYRRNGYGDTEYTTAAGDTISPPFVWPNLRDTVDIALDDPELRVIPHTDGSATNFTALTYHVTDGKGASANVTLQVDVHSVNDAPRVTATDLLEIWEDESISFHFEGHDIELDQYRTLIVTPPLERGYLVHHHFTGDITISGQATLQSISDQANDWPSSFTPTPDDYDAVFYNAFSFVFEEINSGLRSEEHTVNILVHPVNDAPETTLAGVGRATEHDLAATVVDGGTYSIPAVEIDDADHTTFNPNVPTYSISVETDGGAVALEKANYEDAWVVFTETPTSITWQMEPDVTDQGFVSDLTLDNLLSSLTYTPSGTGADTLTITVGDQGFFGTCEATKSGTCNETTTTIITLDVQAGTPPADGTVLPLTQAGGE